MSKVRGQDRTKVLTAPGWGVGGGGARSSAQGGGTKAPGWGQAPEGWRARLL